MNKTSKTLFAISGVSFFVAGIIIAFWVCVLYLFFKYFVYIAAVVLVYYGHRLFERYLDKKIDEAKKSMYWRRLERQIEMELEAEEIQASLKSKHAKKNS